jgi:hypothetical protein
MTATSHPIEPTARPARLMDVPSAILLRAALLEALRRRQQAERNDTKAVPAIKPR